MGGVEEGIDYYFQVCNGCDEGDWIDIDGCDEYDGFVEQEVD